MPDPNDPKAREGRPLPRNFLPLLQCTAGALAGQQWPIRRTQVFLGRKVTSPDDLAINDSGVSGVHARLDIVQKNIYISDMKSTNGTFVNGVKVYRQSVSPSDRLRLGKSLEFMLVMPGEIQGLETPKFDEVALEPVEPEDENEMTMQVERLGQADEEDVKPSVPVFLGILEGKKKRTHRVQRTSVLIGSSSRCDVVLEDPTVSRKHCQIEVLPEGEIRLKDLASANGTALNNNLVSVEMLRNGDVIQVGDCWIKVMTTADA